MIVRIICCQMRTTIQIKFTGNSFPVRPIFDSEDDRRMSWSGSISSGNSESDNQRRETQNVQFQAFMKKFDRLEGDGSDNKGLEVLPEEN